MAFSFFKKKETDADTRMKAAPVAAKSGTPDASVSPLSITGDAAPFGYGADGIEVSAGDSDLSPAEEQAAILFANNETPAAIAVLQAEMQEVRGQRRLETWLMLFELFQQKGDRAAFDQLALEFVVEFEKSSPLWQDRKAAPTKKAQVADNLCAFGDRLTMSTLDKELLKFRAAASKVQSLRLDFSKVKEIDSMAAAEILAIWHLAKKVKAPNQVLGGVSFTKLLASKIETGRNIPAEAPFWLLLIELQQALGKQEEFENFAVEYAITFEVSPPSWDERFAPKLADKVAMEAAAEPKQQQNGNEGLHLQGEITSQRNQGITEIRDYAQKHAGNLILDFDDVVRVDFESAGQFLNLFMDFLQNGREVRIVRTNELVFVLLRLMGVAELVSIERRKN